MSPIEIIATVFGLASVLLTVKQNIWCWPTGIVQVILYVFVFYDARLYADVVLHIIYVFINIYGWYHWLYPQKEKEELRVTRTGRKLIGYILLCIAASIIIGSVMSYYTKASLPYPDSFIMAASLVAQWLMAEKKLENWWFWIVVDVVAIWLYWVKGLYPTTGLYCIFLVLSIIGYFEWKAKLHKIETALVAD